MPRTNARSAGRTLLAWVGLGCALLAAGPRIATPEDSPAADRPGGGGPVGKLAFDDIRAAYASEASSVSRSREAAAKLGSEKAEERAWAAEYLVSLFRQTHWDEANGRTPRGRGMKLWGGPQDDGAAIRW